MTYPASPNDAGPGRVRPDPAQYWAGAVATAVVAALIALVGILVSRWAFNIPILAPAGDGAWGNAHTSEYALLAAFAALLAAGVLYLLMLGTPQPGLFFQWIMGLVTLIAVVYPFSSGAPLDQKGASAIVNLILGIAITSLLTGVASWAIRARRARTVYPAAGSGAGRQYVPNQHYVRSDQGYVLTDQGYVPVDEAESGEGYVREQGYVREEQRPAGGGAAGGGEEPTRPINMPPRGAPRRPWNP